MKEREKAIGLRVNDQLYKDITKMCEDLDGMPINSFALKAVESAIELINSKDPKMPKWISVCRYSLSFKDGQKL